MSLVEACTLPCLGAFGVVVVSMDAGALVMLLRVAPLIVVPGGAVLPADG